MPHVSRRAALLAVSATAIGATLRPRHLLAQQDATSVDLASISPELREDTLRVGDVDIHYVTGGSGPALLLWHGFLGNWYSWRKVLPSLVRSHTVICPDMRGYGGSTTTQDGYDALTLKDDFRGLMRELGHERLHVMAHDMGAPPAFLYAAEHPDEVMTLSYLDEPVMLRNQIAQIIQMTPEHTQLGGLWWWMMAQSPDMTERLIGGNERRFVDFFYDNYTMVDGAIDEQARARFASDLADEDGIRGWFGVYRDVFETIEQTEPYASERIDVPVLALGGEGSLGENVAAMMEMVATNVQGGAVAGSGHFIAEEKPDELVERFVAFADGA